MLTTPELRRWVKHFGVAELQVRRDHLVSHVLHAVGKLDEQLVFIGGTALCRTHLPDWRLSEDVDLLVPEPRRLAAKLQDDLPGMLRREHPDIVIELHADPVGIVGTITRDDLTTRIQLITPDASYRRYPAEPQAVALRYDDLPAQTVLDVPTATSAAAMKLNAWAERGTPRDLCDLFGLADHGMLGDKAIELASDVGWRPAQWMYADDRIPTTRAWRAALGHQMSELPDATAAMATVRSRVFGG